MKEKHCQLCCIHLIFLWAVLDLVDGCRQYCLLSASPFGVCLPIADMEGTFPDARVADGTPLLNPLSWNLPCPSSRVLDDEPERFFPEAEHCQSTIFCIHLRDRVPWNVNSFRQVVISA